MRASLLLLLVLLFHIPTTSHAYRGIYPGSGRIWVGVKADTVVVEWEVDGLYADTLAVYWDLNSYPDISNIGEGNKLIRHDIDDVSGADTLEVTMPKGEHVYFTMYQWDSDSSAWEHTDDGTYSLYVDGDYALGSPRVGAYITGLTKTDLAGAYLESLSVFDGLMIHDYELWDEKWAEYDSIIRPNTKGANGYQRLTTLGNHNEWNIPTSSTSAGIDTVQRAVWRSVKAGLENDVIPFLCTDTTTILATQASPLQLVVVAGEQLNGSEDWRGVDSGNKPCILLMNRSDHSGKYAILRVDSLDIDFTPGKTWDKLHLTNMFANSAQWAKDDSVFIIDSRWHHDSDLLPASGAWVKAKRTDGYLRMETRMKHAAEIYGAVEIDASSYLRKIVKGAFFDNFDKTYAGVQPGHHSRLVVDDSSYVFAASKFTDEDSTGNLYMGANLKPFGLQGVEDSLVSMFGFQAGDWTNVTDSGNRWSADRDLLMTERIAMWEATRYRYGMRSDNWPPYWGFDVYSGSDEDDYRSHAALATIFGQWAYAEKPFSSGLRWIDEFSVARGKARYEGATPAASKHWLERPATDVEYLYVPNSNDTLNHNTTFPSGDDATDWWATGSGISFSIESGIGRTESSDAMRIINSAAYVDYDIVGGVVDDMFDSGYVYSNTAGLTDSTSCTLCFWARVGDKGDQSRMMGVRIQDASEGEDVTLYSTLVHVPDTWKEFCLPIFVDSLRTPGADVTLGCRIEFGLTPVLLPDIGADTIYVDDVIWQEGLSFAGYYRGFAEGVVLVNVTQDSGFVDVPGDSGWYRKIVASDEDWANSSHNDGSFVDDSLWLYSNEAYFLYGPWKGDEWLTDTLKVSIDADSLIGNLNRIWKPGVGLGARGWLNTSEYGNYEGVASDSMMKMWDNTFGFDNGGTYQIIGWFDEPVNNNDSRLDVLGAYLPTILNSMDDERLVVRLVGTPRGLEDSTAAGCYDPPEYECAWDEKDGEYGNPHDPSAYPYKYWDQWKKNVYDAMKYIVAPATDSVSNHYIFPDTTGHQRDCLGLGDGMYFGCWYGFYGGDPFQFMGTHADADSLWLHFSEAADSVESYMWTTYDSLADPPDTTRILRNLNCGGQMSTTWRWKDPDSSVGLWTDGGIMEDLIEFSGDPDGNPYTSDSLRLDMIDIQHRTHNPWSVSEYKFEGGRAYDSALVYLNQAGYDTTEIPVNLVEWHSQKRVYGLYNSIGDYYRRKSSDNNEYGPNVEDQCELDAALAPAILMDFETRGLPFQWREFMQDALNQTEGHPLFHTFDGTLGIGTIGFYNSDSTLTNIPLKKANWNVFEMLDKLGHDRLLTEAKWGAKSATKLWGSQWTVNAITVEDTLTHNIQILLWSYVDPMSHTVDTGDDARIRYRTLYMENTLDMGQDSLYVQLILDDLPAAFGEASGSLYYNQKRWVVDKYTSNAFEYRDKLCWALDYPDTIYVNGDTLWTKCAEWTPEGEANWGDSSYTMGELNTWTSTNNPYDSSVALEMVHNQSYSSAPADPLKIDLMILPYSVTLIELDPDPPSDGD